MQFLVVCNCAYKCNYLIISGVVVCRKSRCKTCRFIVQNTALYNAKHGLLCCLFQ